MKWMSEVPPTATACGQGVLDIEMPSGAAALEIAKIGAGAYVTAQVTTAVTTALRGSTELRQQLGHLPTPELVYRLGEPQELSPGVWRIPFWAYALPRGP
jgi:hypothetical protein